MKEKQYNVHVCKSHNNYIHVLTFQISVEYICTSHVIANYKYKFMYIFILINYSGMS